MNAPTRTYEVRARELAPSSRCFRVRGECTLQSVRCELALARAQQNLRVYDKLDTPRAHIKHLSRVLPPPHTTQAKPAQHTHYPHPAPAPPARPLPSAPFTPTHHTQTRTPAPSPLLPSQQQRLDAPQYHHGFSPTGIFRNPYPLGPSTESFGFMRLRDSRPRRPYCWPHFSGNTASCVAGWALGAQASSGIVAPGKSSSRYFACPRVPPPNTREQHSVQSRSCSVRLTHPARPQMPVWTTTRDTSRSVEICITSQSPANLTACAARLRMAARIARRSTAHAPSGSWAALHISSAENRPPAPNVQRASCVPAPAQICTPPGFPLPQLRTSTASLQAARSVGGRQLTHQRF
ncbi:hypothetical protein B0H10DRAFT_2439867, partial [Mycena sp. CBHHK59/15]